MIKILKIEILRSFKNRAMIFTLALGLIITLSQIFMSVIPAVRINRILTLDNYPMTCPINSFQGWIGNDVVSPHAFLFYFLLPVLAIIPYGTSYFEDLHSGYIKQIVLRTEKKHYFISKYLAVFISGGTSVTVPLMVNFLISNLLLPSFVPQVEQNYFVSPIHMWSRLLFTHPYVYILGLIVITFIFSGLLADLALTISLIVDYKFIVMVMPLIIYIFLYSIMGTLGLNEFVPFYFLKPGTEICNGYIVLGEIIVLGVFTIVTFIMGGAKDDIY